jgi:hypothetical protein
MAKELIKGNETAKSESVNLEERRTKALERIADTLEDMNDWVYALEVDVWSERIEWYLNEFYMIAKAKTVGSVNRPARDAERTEPEIETNETEGDIPTA